MALFFLLVNCLYVDTVSIFKIIVLYILFQTLYFWDTLIEIVLTVISQGSEETTSNYGEEQKAEAQKVTVVVEDHTVQGED